MPITSLHFTNVGPFDDIQFEFDPQVNVFTGPNNCGKSTALIVLGDILVYPFAFPSKLLKSDKATWNGQFLLEREVQPFSGEFPNGLDQILPLLERIGYTTFIPALRRSTDFRSQGPSASQARETSVREQTDRTLEWMFQDYPHLMGSTGLENARLMIERSIAAEVPELRKRRALFFSSPSVVADEAVIQKIIELDYGAYRRGKPEIRGMINKVAAIASEIIEGFPIEFMGVGEDERGLFPQLQTPDGVLPLNSLSQGTQSTIQWLARLLFSYAEYYDYPMNLEEKPGILIIDEVDAHLHPSWQRRIIPTLTKHFPNLQIFCSTHSPLMLAGLKEGQVQLLRRDEKGKVTVSRNETDIVGWSADEILRNVLDVPSPTDLETVERIKRMQELMDKESLSAQESKELEQLRHTINLDLLGGPVAGQVERLADMLKQIKGEFAAGPKQPASASRGGATRRRSRPAK
jgi:hypothetical protein